MDIKDAIWIDFLNCKLGYFYCSLYLGRQRNLRRWFKIITILFAAGGIWSALSDFKIPTIIITVTIAVVQLLSLLETHILRHSEKDIDDINKLIVLYYLRANELQDLVYCLDEMSMEECRSKLFASRKKAKEIEELDNKIGIRKIDKLHKKADIQTREYIKSYHHG